MITPSAAAAKNCPEWIRILSGLVAAS